MVILFGAIVRITGSGAGCGQHWPTCHGEVLHLPSSVETAIELSHRASSGLDLLLCVAVLILSIRRFPQTHWARRGAWLSLFFMITEALVGARLVLSELVGMNDSLPRAVVMMIHLVNTSLLTSAILITTYAARSDSPRFEIRDHIHSNRRLFSLVAIFGIILGISCTGAVTALGDTVYPVAEHAGGVVARIASDQNSGSHFLQRLRIVHPLVAVVGSALVVLLALRLHDGAEHRGRVWLRWTMLLIMTQVGLGVVNIILSAPGWMQVAHLAVGTAIWSTLTWSALHLLEAPSAVSSSGNT